MAAQDHFGPQLQMFIPAHVLASEVPGYRHGDRRDTDSLAELRQDKVAQSKQGSAYWWGDRRKPGEPSLYESIAQSGVQHPVSLTIAHNPDTEEVETRLTDGHHRVFSAQEVSEHRRAENVPNPDLEIPVTYDATERYVSENYPLSYEANWEKYR